MAWLWLILEVLLESFASWTLAVHLCIAIALPAWVAWLFFVAIFAGCLALGGGRHARRLRGALGESLPELRFAAATIGLGALFGIGSLVQLTTSGDDFNFFHRAVWQLERLGEPFARGDTAFNVEGLAAISPLHALTTWELGLAMTAHALGLEPLGVYHNGASFLLNVVFAVVMGLWMRELRLPPASSLCGVAAAFAFCWIDDPQLRSFGIAHRMLWVGKMVQWLVLFPAALLIGLRYLRDPSRRTLWYAFLCGVCAVGLSGAGVFLLPGLFAAASLAGLAFGRISLPQLVRCGLLNLGSLYCFGVATLMLAGWLPQPDDVRAWVDSFPSEWTENLMLVFGTAGGLVRAAALAILVPALVFEGRGARFLWLYALVLIALFANPVAAPLWIDAVQPGSFWRVALLVPLPMLFGASIAAAIAGLPTRGLSGFVAVAVVSLVLFSRFSPAPAARRMAHDFDVKSPLELRFDPGQLAFLRAVADDLAGRSLLAPPGVGPTAALLVPSVRLEAARLQDTRHVFANAGQAEEGERRLKAWEWTRRCNAWNPGAMAVRVSMREGVDAMILRDCGPRSKIDAERRRLMDRDAAPWREAHRSDGYILYLAG